MILHPTAATVEEHRFTTAAPEAAATVAGVVELSPVVTGDGVSITLRANVELPAEFQAVGSLARVAWDCFVPSSVVAAGLDASEEQQYQAYKALADAAGSDGAVVRLFDVGGEGWQRSEGT